MLRDLLARDAKMAFTIFESQTRKDVIRVIVLESPALAGLLVCAGKLPYCKLYFGLVISYISM